MISGLGSHPSRARKHVMRAPRKDHRPTVFSPASYAPVASSTGQLACCIASWMIHSATHFSGLTGPCLILERTQACTFRRHPMDQAMPPISLFPSLLLSLPPAVLSSLTHSVLFFFPSSIPSFLASFFPLLLPFVLYFSPLFLSLFPLIDTILINF